jgi:arsenical pump membrane protein
VLLTPDPPLHGRALLLGLNIGPNLAVTGSLALLWLRVVRSLGARPSAATYSRVGIVLAPLTLAASLAALRFVAPGRI